MAANAVQLQAGDREVRLSSPDRVLWPEVGITKQGLAEYAIAVADAFLAANGDRPVALERYSEGVDGDSFFSKNPPKGAPEWLRSVPVVFPSARSHPLVVLDEPASIVWAVQMNTIVFHPWPARTANTDNPDQLRIDLDPQPGTGFADAVPAALEMRNVLREAGLEGWIKTSGNRGIHLYAPIAPEWEFLEVRHAVIAAARELERRMPDRVTTSWWKEERGEKVFVDFNQANRDRTIAGAYSPRALPHAPVSTPLTWDELEHVDPKDFTVLTVPERLRTTGDPWSAFASNPGRIDILLQWWERDVADGLGELPFPPDFPKMPGEPPRVQPSKKNADNWDADGNPIAG